MTKKHFIVLAAMLKAIPSMALRLKFAAELIAVCKEENQRFSEVVFRKAADCEIEN